MPKKIYMLVGVPASGKSTWTEKEFQGDCHVVSTDKIIDEIAFETGRTYDQVFSQYMKVAEKMMWEEFDKYIEGGYSPIVVDRTNMSVKSRRKFFERLKNFHRNHRYEIEAVVFKTPEETEWNRRLNSRVGKTIPQHVLESMARSYEQPRLTEGFTKVSLA
jgi:predicted kinase